MVSYHWRALATEFGHVEILESGLTQLQLVRPEWVDDVIFGPNGPLRLRLQVFDPIHDRLVVVHIEVDEEFEAFVLAVRLAYIGLIESLRSAAIGCTSAN
jgi:hypothetical protein